MTRVDREIEYAFDPHLSGCPPISVTGGVGGVHSPAADEECWRDLTAHSVRNCIERTVDCDAMIAAVQAGGPPPERKVNEPPTCGAMRGHARVLSGGIIDVTVRKHADPGHGRRLRTCGANGCRQVIDKTGLTGRFTFTVAWTPERPPDAAPPARRGTSLPVFRLSIPGH